MGSHPTLFSESTPVYKRQQEYIVETICCDLEREGYSSSRYFTPAGGVGGSTGGTEFTLLPIVTVQDYKGGRTVTGRDLWRLSVRSFFLLKSIYTTAQIAKELSMSVGALSKRLKWAGIQFCQSGQWLLKGPCQNQDYTATHTQQWENQNGDISTAMLTVWTEKDWLFIHCLLETYLV